MKRDLELIALILAMIALPMLTSTLLELNFINKETSRKLLIYLLMFIEIFAVLMIIIDFLKKQTK